MTIAVAFLDHGREGVQTYCEANVAACVVASLVRSKVPIVSVQGFDSADQLIDQVPEISSCDDPAVAKAAVLDLAKRCL